MSEITATPDLDIPSWINDAVHVKRYNEERQQQRNITRHHNKLQSRKRLAVAVGALALSIALIAHASTSKTRKENLQNSANLGLPYSQEVTEVSPSPIPLIETTPEQIQTPAIEKETNSVDPYTFNDLDGGNIVTFSPEVSSKINQYADKYDLDEKFIAAAAMQESRGDANAKSTDGFNSFGLLQPSLNYHIHRYAPHLEKAGLLQEIATKPAKDITASDNDAIFAKFQSLPDNWKSKQDITRVFCDPDANLDVGCGYMRECFDQAKEQCPDLNKSGLLVATVAAYNGGPDKINAMYEFIKTGKTSGAPGFANAKEHARKVMAFYTQK